MYPAAMPVDQSEQASDLVQISLCDVASNKTSLMKLLGDIFELMPKVPMGLVGKPDGEGSTQLSDIDEARKRGKAMAEAVNKKGA